MGRLEHVVVSDFIELIRAVTSNKHGVLVLVAERDLSHATITADSNLLLSEALGFVPSPEDDSDIWFPC